MKAVILAAGEGTRLEPLTNVRPKPMLPVSNKPLLEHVVEAVVAAGFEEIVLVVGYKRERIQNHFGDGDRFPADISYVFQEPQLGTGDAILQARDVVEDDFVVLNGDRILESDIISAVGRRRRETGETCMAVTESAEPGLYGVVDIEGDRIEHITEKPGPHERTSDLINAGVYGFGPEIFAAIRETESHGELAITEVLNQHREELGLCPEHYGGRWLDVSRPWDILSVNGRVLDADGGSVAASATVESSADLADAVALDEGAVVRSGAVLERGTAIGENATVGPNAVVENSVVLPDTRIGAGSVIRDAVIGGNVSLGPNATVEGGSADVILEDTLHRDVRLGGIIGDNATLGGDVALTPGTRLGNDTRVRAHTLLEGWIDPGTQVTGR